MISTLPQVEYTEKEDFNLYLYKDFLREKWFSDFNEEIINVGHIVFGSENYDICTRHQINIW